MVCEKRLERVLLDTVRELIGRNCTLNSLEQIEEANLPLSSLQ